MNPRFTVRLGREEERKPVYVVDRTLRFPLTARLLTTAKDLVVFHGTEFDKFKAKELQARGVTLIQVAKSSSGLDLRSVLAVIGERGVHDLWVEAGARFLRSLVTESLLDRLHLLVAPTFLPVDSLGVFDSQRGTELDLRSALPQVEWRTLGNVGLCTLERKPK